MIVHYLPKFTRAEQQHRFRFVLSIPDFGLSTVMVKSYNACSAWAGIKERWGGAKLVTVEQVC